MDEDAEKKAKWLRRQFVRWDVATYWPAYLGALLAVGAVVVCLFGLTDIPDDARVPGAIGFGLIAAVLLMWVRAKRAGVKTPGGGEANAEKGVDMPSRMVLSEQEKADGSSETHSNEPPA